jgi:hypothetical protein
MTTLTGFALRRDDGMRASLVARVAGQRGAHVTIRTTDRRTVVGELVAITFADGPKGDYVTLRGYTRAGGHGMGDVHVDAIQRIRSTASMRCPQCNAGDGLGTID